MSEPRTEVNSPSRPPGDGVPTGDSTTASSHGKPQAPASPDTHALPNLEAIAAADDSPTIISRAAQRNRHPDEGVVASLRGKHLAHFELMEAVGVGGMAAVIRAQDKQLDRCVALKILPPQMATDPESIRRFHQEARSAARLDHENIARVFFCGEDQGLHFIAFEFVEGENLRVAIERRGRIPVPEAIHYILQVATGLAHASARGVVHRDIKPSNIIVTPTGKAKLVDMGLARSLGPQSEGDLTQSGVTLGTFDYISPEQALEPRDADVRSDIYSLGCTFYHMLTGQPPVPEGTAAKKLHFHQHVPPIDPRQLNADVNDEVAAVVGRMMAKDPRERFQTPEHLVQQLVQLAQKCGCPADVPDGMVFVDQPLPHPPRALPVLVTLIAAAAVVVLAILMGSMSSSPAQSEGGTNVAPPRNIDPQPPGGETTPIVGPVKPPDDPTPIVPTAKWSVARTSKELAQFLKQPNARIRLAGDMFELKAEEGSAEAPGLVFRGEEVVIEPDDPLKRPTIALKYDPSIGKKQLWAALSVAGGKATLNGLRFVIDATGTDTAMTAIVQNDGGTLTVKNCEFQQSGFATESSQRRMSCVTLSATTRGGRPTATFDRCLFRGGDDAFLLTGPGTLQLVNCAFGPHASLVHCLGTKVEPRETEVTLASCSAMLEGGSAAFHLEDGAACKLFLNHCLVSSPSNGAEIEADGAVLVRQSGERFIDFQYESQYRNVFQNLIGYWVRQSARNSDVVAMTLREFKERLEVSRTDSSIELTTNPWATEKPVALIDKQPKLAFSINLKLPELRQEKAPTKRVVGVERCTWGELYENPLPPVEDKKPDPVVRKFKIVDPKATESGLGVYPSIDQASKDCRAGDVILIRHNGLLAIEPVRLEKASTDVTIKPHPRFRPILTVGQASDTDVALFRVLDGKVNFEDLEFLLKPQRTEFKAQSVVMVAGDGQCSFKNCLATLEPAKDVPLSFATLADPSTVMKMEPMAPRQQGPRLRLENCFVRGDGDLVTVRASRPFSLEIEDSLVVLDGSFLVVDGNPKEAPAKPSAHLSVRQVTAVLSDHLVLLRAGKEEGKQGLVPMQVTQASNCIFHSMRGNRALIHLEGVDSDEQMKRIFSWGEGKQNLYSSFAQMLNQHPRGENAMPLPPYDQDKWVNFTSRETEPRFTKAKFLAWPVQDRPLSRTWAANFKVKEPEGTKSGAPVDRLPRPTGSGESEPPSSEPE
ncbi:MAG: serine/threonine protein kinase [Gemmataceae bacterium]|nr:serine/threonine protein kinase [Gemmataceae bacterium]